MGKRKRNRKSPATCQQQIRAADRTRNWKRNPIVISVLVMFVVAIVALLTFGSSPNRSSSDDSSTSFSLLKDAPAEQAQKPPSTGHGPSIHFPEPEFDFGSIPEGAKVSHTFVVQNTGDEPLKLIRAKGG